MTPPQQQQKQTIDLPCETNTPADYHVLDVLSDRLPKGQRTAMEARLEMALDRFPELEGETVTVGRLKPSKEYTLGDPIAVADPYNRMVYFDVDEAPTNLTIYHELAHLAVRARIDQGDTGDVGLPPSSEPFTSIYSVAKMPADAIDRDFISYLGEPTVPRGVWPETCRRALAYRAERGKNSHYVQKAKEWLGILEDN